VISRGETPDPEPRVVIALEAECITPHRFVNQVPLREGDDALPVNWFELTTTRADGRAVDNNAFATHQAIAADNVANIENCWPTTPNLPFAEVATKMVATFPEEEVRHMPSLTIKDIPDKVL